MAAAEKARNEARKAPRQARSRATVDAILEAAAQVLVAVGYERATTARIAERAGVSVGTLYQYFPAKEAVVAALIERHTAEMEALAAGALAPDAPGGPRAALRRLVAAAIRAHAAAPELHKALVEQVPRVGRMGEALDTSRRVAALIEAHLARHAGALGLRGDARLAAFALETVVEALAHRAVVEAPPWLDRDALTALATRVAEACLAEPASG